MKNSYSNIFPLSEKTLNKTIKLLTKGRLVALPTETVYGLAGNGYSREAIKKIYRLKGRPKLNPLIILASFNDLLFKSAGIISFFI